MKAMRNGTVIAESDETIVLEGNHYFPAQDIHSQYFSSSQRHTTCPHKGVASYHDIIIEGETNAGAARYYPSPKPGYEHIANYVAFWKGVQIEE